MYQVLTCLTQEHNLALVGLAGLICFLSSHVAMTLLGRGRTSSGFSKWLWLATAGAFGGFGIWSTHFIAMLAYDPGVVVGYQASLTFLSLALAIVATWAAVTSAVYFEGRFASLMAGLLFGLGVGSMHFTGMFAIEFPGTIVWDQAYVWASVILGTALSIFAFNTSRYFPAKLTSGFVPTILMTVSVVALHFIAMGGVSVVAGPDSLDATALLSPTIMVVAIATVSLSLLSSGLFAATFALRAENKVAAGEKNFRMLVQGVTDYAIYTLDLEGRVSNWNAGAQRAKGYTAKEIVGKDFALFYSEDDRRKGLPQKALEMARTHGKFEAQGWRYRKDGTSFWAYVVIDAIYDDEHNLIGYAKITKDNTQQKADAERIEAVTRNLDIALENMSQGLCLFDGDQRLVLANKRYGELFGFADGAVRSGMTYREIIESGYRAHVTDDPTRFAELTGQHYERNIAIIRAGGGKLVHEYANGRSLQHTYNTMADGGWVVTIEDVTERLRADEQISFMAKHDVLTSLPNRLQYSEYLAQEIIVANRTNTRLAVIGIDLDKFKEINDQHGHAVGDTVLIELARRMTEALQQEEFVARFGGDEFAAVKRFADMAELHDFIARIESSLCGEIEAEGFEIKTGASFGIALYPQDATRIELLLANADLAMYRAKNSLVQRVCFYEVAMDEAARSRRSLANDLWAAIDNDEMHLHYQVQKSVSTGEITGYEVLLRWQHPERGNIPPMDFITLAEECGAILPIGEWVLREACRQAAGWDEPHKIAVNLSPVQLGHADMASLVHKILLETGLNPHLLEIEITESSIITDKAKALHTLRQIKNLGVSIAIDDFGTGYSSLETLRAFPFDKIKLDKSFMSEVETSAQAKAIVRAILALGQSLDVPVLAEGVETQAQLDILLEERCDEAQGYLLGRPKPINDILTAAIVDNTALTRLAS